MGRNAENIFQSFQLTPIDATNFDIFLQKFENYFIVQQNVIYEHVKFKQRIQLVGERVDEFITTLYTLVDHCDYGALKEGLICDRIIVGIKDKGLWNVTTRSKSYVKKTVDQVRQSEAIQQQFTCDVDQSITVDRIQFKKETNLQRCLWCGGQSHRRQNCPTSNKLCNNCKKKGHFFSLPCCKGNFGSC